MSSLVLFTAGSALCATATTTSMLVLFRVLQGFGGGMIMPLAMLIMAQVAGPQRIGRVMPIVSMPAMLAPILGPVVGGLILQKLNWPWIFLVNVPIGVVAFIAGWRIIPHTESGPAGKLDVLGLLLLPVGSALTVFGLSKLGSGGSLGSPEVLVPIILGLALSRRLLLARAADRAPAAGRAPIHQPSLRGGVPTTFWLGAALFGAMILVPLYYQEVRHESVLVTGLLVGRRAWGC